MIGFALLPFFTSLALAHDFYITQPWAETRWKAGQIVRITWKLYTDVGPEASGINIDLMDGEDLSANFLLNIAHNLRPDSTSFEWAIPMTVNSDEGLFVRITGLGEVANYRFSHRFSISGGEAPAVTVTVIPKEPTVNVDELVRKLPPGSKHTGLPPVVSLIDGNGVQVVTETVSVRPTEFANRDRLAMSGAEVALPSVILMALGLIALLY